MSIWGTENFERDDALNVLDNWIRGILTQIRETFLRDHETSLYYDFGESRIIGNIDILTTLLERYRIDPDIELDEINKWKTDYLNTFDRTIHRYEPKPQYVTERRKKIEDTFARFYEIVNEIYSE